MAFMGFWGTGVEPGTQYTEKVSCTVWKMTSTHDTLSLLRFVICVGGYNIFDKDYYSYILSRPRLATKTGKHARINNHSRRICCTMHIIG